MGEGERQRAEDKGIDARILHLDIRVPYSSIRGI